MTSDKPANELRLEYSDNYQLVTTNRVLVDGRKPGREDEAISYPIKGATYFAYEGCCPLCAALDGVDVAVDSEEFYACNPGHHDGCRCLWVYVEEGEEDWEPTTDVYQRIIHAAGDDLAVFLERHASTNAELRQVVLAWAAGAREGR